MKRRAAIGVFVLCLVTGIPGASAKGPDEQLRATLDGELLRIQLVGRYHCHDLDSPIIRCYRTSEELEAVVSARIAANGTPEGAEAVSYVRVYENRDYLGTSAYLAQDYSDLGTIGWNDRITSLRSVNGGAGRFHHDADHEGTPYAFCCNDSVANVGSTHNDKFSSVERE